MVDCADLVSLHESVVKECNDLTLYFDKRATDSIIYTVARDIMKECCSLLHMEMGKVPRDRFEHAREFMYDVGLMLTLAETYYKDKEVPDYMMRLYNLREKIAKILEVSDT